MARIDWVELRLVNWARWRAMRGGCGSLGYAAVQIGQPNAGRSGYVEAAVPASDVEARETDDAVNQLCPAGLRITLIEVYCGCDGVREKAVRLCCTEGALHARVERAQHLLARYFAERECAARNERDRVEALQRGAHGLHAQGGF